MRKRILNLLLIVVTLGLAVVSCKKDDSNLNPKLVNESKEVHSNSVKFQWGIEFSGVYSSGVVLSQNMNMSDSTFYQGTQSGNRFTCQINDLMPNTTYYFRYVVWNTNDRWEFEPASIKTEAGVPILNTKEAENVAQSSATLGGVIVNNGGAAVTSCGICWGTETGPDINGLSLASDQVSDNFSLSITGLRANTRYYARAYATNSMGTGYGKEVTFYTGEATLPEVAIKSITVYSSLVTIMCNVVSDGGIKVTERGVCWSTSPYPDYNSNHVSNGSGMGSFRVELSNLDPETQYHVRVYATNSLGTAYSEDRTFTTSAGAQAPEGAINGLFSVGGTKKVWFSKGNLQYIGSAIAPYWKFAENQWTVIGYQSQNTPAPNVDRDLFGWGTSGYHNSSDSYNVNYQPYSTSNTEIYSGYNPSNVYGYGPSINQSNPNIAGSHYDWGVHNMISNGGNQAGIWRTLTKDEWYYLFNSRSASTINGTNNSRFAKAVVNNIHGVILFPDSYSHPAGVAVPFGINETGNTGWNYNTYNTSDWAQMEAKGCVFLPAGGQRNGSSVYEVGYTGYYWSSSYSSNNSAFRVHFDESYMGAQSIFYRYYGYSVRLVQAAQ